MNEQNMMKKHTGIDQDTFHPIVSITNRYRNHYRRGCLKLTYEDVIKKERPWLLFLPEKRKL
jgi:hypothetical protein